MKAHTPVNPPIIFSHYYASTALLTAFYTNSDTIKKPVLIPLKSQKAHIKPGVFWLFTFSNYRKRVNNYITAK